MESKKRKNDNWSKGLACIVMTTINILLQNRPYKNLHWNSLFKLKVTTMTFIFKILDVFVSRVNETQCAPSIQVEMNMLFTNDTYNHNNRNVPEVYVFAC